MSVPTPSPLEVALAAIGDGYKAHLVWQLFWGAPLGETLKPIVGGMYEWGLRNHCPDRIAMSARPDPGAA
jgi:DNA-binding HxlR family transcriptional regulator